MNRLLFILLFIGSLKLKSGEDYRYYVNLNKVFNDKVTVTLTPPDIKEDAIEFLFPAMVPGTYEVYDFGRFISNFKVSGKNGQVMTVTKLNVNAYKISPASKIDRITYDVDDTFDKCDLPGTKDKIVFEPGGTNFEEGKNFAMNTFSMFGYFKGLSGRNFRIEFEKPKGFYPSTGLNNITLGETMDVINVFGYHQLADSPIMYFLPDTATIRVANTDVLISCYSPNKTVTAKFIAGALVDLLKAQKDYLGGELPVSKYAFLFYFQDKPSLSGSSGALEHSYSSFYVMPELPQDFLQQQLRDVAAHEFFHIVTPLSIHSKEIGDFDFNAPKMSEHLWLYEGMTEYAAHHAQVKAGLINVNEFLNTMMQKYQTSVSGFNDTMSFTYMSKHVLEEKIHSQYGNVYEKGALIGMCLDILLRDKSDGKYGTQNLMRDLSTLYGKDKSFNDEDLFNDIEKFTYPEIGNFLRKYVGGTSPLPMQEIFNKAGIDFMKETFAEDFTLGNPDLSYTLKAKRLKVYSVKNLDEFGKELGYKRGDEIYKLNGKELEMERMQEIIAAFYANLKEGDVVTVEVFRPRLLLPKKYKQVTLTAKAKKVKKVRTNQISVAKNVTAKQQTTFRTWLGL